MSDGRRLPQDCARRGRLWDFPPISLLCVRPSKGARPPGYPGWAAPSAFAFVK